LLREFSFFVVCGVELMGGLLWSGKFLILWTIIVTLYLIFFVSAENLLTKRKTWGKIIYYQNCKKGEYR